MSYKHNKTWRYKHTEARKKQNYDYYNKRSFSPNKYNRWTLKEIRMIMDHDLTDTELSKILGRSVRAIQTKRHLVSKRKEA